MEDQEKSSCNNTKGLRHLSLAYSLGHQVIVSHLHQRSHPTMDMLSLMDDVDQGLEPQKYDLISY